MELFVFMFFMFYVPQASAIDDSCCKEGLKYGKKIFGRGNTNCVDTSRQRDLYCQMLFRQCCEHKLNNIFCTTGKALSSAKLMCVEGSSSVKKFQDVQLSCCECCTKGRQAGERKQSCNAIGDKVQQYCRLAYKTCCEKARKKDVKKIPTTITTTTPKPTTTTTTRRIFGPTCAEVTCDPKTSIGCHVTSDGVSRCRCKPDHYNYARFICKALEKCRTGRRKCLTSLYCMEQKGEAKCYFNCPSPGYHASIMSDRKICEDKDECALKTSRCTLETQDCINTVGGYRCVTTRCQKGLKMVNGKCEDINECLEENICGKGICRNYHGSYFCDCSSGYTLNRTTKKCVDINECAISHRKYCDYKCTNTDGSFECSCPEGYRSLGEDCIDINECEQNPNICSLEKSYCFNTYGSYMCIDQSCPNSNYYIQNNVKGEPDACVKDCNEAPSYEERNSCLIGPTPYSIKRVTYKYERVIGVNGFVYRYWWNFPQQKYEVYLAKGNDDKKFEVQYVTPQRIQLKSIKEIKGPRRIQLTMYMDVRQRNQGKPLRRRNVTYLYIDVSEHAFSLR